MRTYLSILLALSCLSIAADGLSLSSTTAPFNSAGGQSSVVVTGSFTATSPVPWITLNPVSGGVPGQVNYSVATNTGGDRTATLTIAGQPFTVTQSAPVVQPPSATNWLIGFGGTLNDAGNSVAVDTNGYAYVGGSFSTPLVVTNRAGSVINLASAGGSDIFIMKIGRDSAIEWVKGYGSTGDEAVKRILVDGTGNIYLGGTFNGTCTFGKAAAVYTSSNVDGYIAKYSPAGDLLWVQTVKGPSYDYVNDIALDSTGANVVATGFFSGTTVFAGAKALTSDIAGPDTFLLKCSTATGALVWAKSFVNKDYDSGQVVCVGSDNSIYLAGIFRTRITIDTVTFSSAGTQFLFDLYIAKFADSGPVEPSTPLWERRAGGIGADVVYAGALDAQGNLILGGYFDHQQTDLGTGVITGTASGYDAFLVKYSGATGAALWAQPFRCVNAAQVQGIAVDGGQNAVATGVFNGGCAFPLTVGSQTAAVFGTDDGFIVRCDGATGLVRSASDIQSFGGRYADQGSGVAIDLSLGSPGVPVTTGSYQTATFPGPVALKSNGYNDAFVMRRP